MDMEFAPAKDPANRDKHGVPFSAGADLFADVAHLVVPSFRKIMAKSSLR